METETDVRTVGLKWALFSRHKRLGQHEQEPIVTFPEELTDMQLLYFAVICQMLYSSRNTSEKTGRLFRRSLCDPTA